MERGSTGFVQVEQFLDVAIYLQVSRIVSTSNLPSIFALAVARNEEDFPQPFESCLAARLSHSLEARFVVSLDRVWATENAFSSTSF